MKKIFSILPMLMIFVLTFAFAGCSSQFDGDYQEATVNQQSTVVESVQAKDTVGLKSFDLINGVQFDYLLTYSDGTNYNVNIKMKQVNDEIQFYTKVVSQISTYECWYKDGYYAVLSNDAGKEFKTKKMISFDNAIVDFQIDVNKFDFISICTLYDTYDSFKFYIEELENETKVKLTLNEVVDEYFLTDLIAYYIFDADFNVKALSAEIKYPVTADSDEVYSLYKVTVSAYNQAIQFPDFSQFNNVGV